MLERVLHGGRFLLTSILAGVLFMLAIALILVANLIWIPILSAIVGPGGLAVFLFIVVGVAIACVVASYVSARFSQFPYMILDYNAGGGSSRWAGRGR